MSRRGRLEIGSIARLDEGEVQTRLAICGESDPFDAAIRFLGNLQAGEEIVVEGSPGRIGGVTVFCMTSARHADAVFATARRERRAAKKKSPKKTASPAKKTAAKRGSKKSARNALSSTKASKKPAKQSSKKASKESAKKAAPPRKKASTRRTR